MFSVPDRSDTLYFFIWKFLVHTSKPTTSKPYYPVVCLQWYIGVNYCWVSLFVSFFLLLFHSKVIFWNQCLPNASWSDAALYQIHINKKRIYSYFNILLFTLLFILSSQGNYIWFSLLFFYLFNVAQEF